MIKSEVKKSILDVVRSCDSVQFCTIGLNKYPETRNINNKLNKLDKSDNLVFHFITNVNSHKIEQIRKNSSACLYYFNPQTRKALTLFGVAKDFTDKKTKSDFWDDDWKAFGYNGKEDPSYTIIEFTPKIYKYYLSATDEKTGDI